MNDKIDIFDRLKIIFSIKEKLKKEIDFNEIKNNLKKEDVLFSSFLTEDNIEEKNSIKRVLLISFLILMSPFILVLLIIHNPLIIIKIYEYLKSLIIKFKYKNKIEIFCNYFLKEKDKLKIKAPIFADIIIKDIGVYNKDVLNLVNNFINKLSIEEIEFINNLDKKSLEMEIISSNRYYSKLRFLCNNKNKITIYNYKNNIDLINFILKENKDRECKEEIKEIEHHIGKLLIENEVLLKMNKNTDMNDLLMSEKILNF